MRYQANQKIYHSSTIHLMQDDTVFISRREGYSKEHSNMLLKLWRNDYPYLSNNENCFQGCLPIPEDSDAQRYIRRLTEYPQAK